MKDIKPLLLGMLSVGLIGTWVYHLYDKATYSNKRKEIYIKDSIAVAQGVQDSLQKIYATTIDNLDAKLEDTRSKSDSLKYQLDDKLGEIYRLKGEINDILKNRGASKDELNVARGKIRELKELIEGLKQEKLSMEDEKEQLNNVMSQLNGEITGLQQDMKRLGDENKALAAKVNMASVFVSSEMYLSAVAVKSGKEIESNNSKKISKFVVYFTVQNNVSSYEVADVYVVIREPDGSILKDVDMQESTGSFTLQNGTTSAYSRRVKFDYYKGDSKKLLFSLNAEKYVKGTYTLQLFHKGYMIGQITKTLE